MKKFYNVILDWVTGFDIDGELKKVLAMDSWSREQIVSNQREKFSHLSRIAGKSEYYRLLGGKPLDDFPVMERTEFKLNADALKTHIRKPYSVQSTSGSTGFPVTLQLSKEMILAKRVSHQKMLTWNGLRRESPEFKIGGIRQDLKTMIYYYFRNKRYINSFYLSLSNIETIIKKYNRFKPEILYGYPSAIYNFIQNARQRNRPLHQPVIIATHAEKLYDDCVEGFNEAFPDTRLVNQYWCTEANIGVSCPDGHIHIDEDTVICEVINKNEKGVGDLLITNLYSFDQPIIRYHNGDRVRLSDKPCGCGRNTMVIDLIEGRYNSELELPDGRKLPVMSIYLSRYTDNCLSYQLRYFKKKSLIEFRYIPIDPARPIKEGEITKYLKHEFGLKTSFYQVEDLEYTNGGKFRKVINMD